MPDYRIDGDDMWKPAEPLGWAEGLDWEVMRQEAGDYVACLYDKTIQHRVHKGPDGAVDHQALWQPHTCTGENP